MSSVFGTNTELNPSNVDYHLLVMVVYYKTTSLGKSQTTKIGVRTNKIIKRNTSLVDIIMQQWYNKDTLWQKLCHFNWIFVCLKKQCDFILFTLVVTECCMFCGFKHPLVGPVFVCLVCQIQFNNVSTESLLFILYFLSLRYCKKKKKKLIVFIIFFAQNNNYIVF